MGPARRKEGRARTSGGGGDRRAFGKQNGRGRGREPKRGRRGLSGRLPRPGPGRRASSSRQAARGLTLSGPEHHRRRRVPTAPPRSIPETAAGPDGQEARTFPFLSGDLEARHDPEVGWKADSDPRSSGLLGRFARGRKVTGGGGGGRHRRLSQPAALRPDGRPPRSSHAASGPAGSHGHTPRPPRAPPPDSKLPFRGGGRGGGGGEAEGSLPGQDRRGSFVPGTHLPRSPPPPARQSCCALRGSPLRLSPAPPARRVCCSGSCSPKRSVLPGWAKSEPAQGRFGRVFSSPSRRRRFAWEGQNPARSADGPGDVRLSARLPWAPT